MSTWSDPRRQRRVGAGIGLVGFSALLVAEEAFDTGSGTFVETAVAYPGRLLGSAVVLLGSAILTVPAIAGIVHQARDRGSVLAHVGGFLTLLGAFGHMGIATVSLVMRSFAGGDPAEMAAFEDRLNADPVLLIPFVLISSFGVGIALLAGAAWRAGLIGWWGPALITAVVVAHLALPDNPPLAVRLAALISIAVVFGRLGVRTLRLSDLEWDARPKASATSGALLG